MSKKKNLDIYLGEIFKRYIAIKDDDYKKSQEVFRRVFDEVKKNMGEQCSYFGKYGNQVLFAGSVADGIKVSKLDEFDMDIVIKLPINYDNGIMIEPDEPGFVKLKITDAFDNLDKQQDWEKCHKVTRDWRDDDKYFLQSKFRQWMHGNVKRALNDLGDRVVVGGVTYNVTYKESGPAYTLHVRGTALSLDVDLVPVVRFMHPRWPAGYRAIQESSVKDWHVVPKPNKALQDGKLKNRCWRLSFQEFERDMIKGCQQLKTTIRLVKKLRDTLQMKHIASYYIKTLFLWKIDKHGKTYWQNKLSNTFPEMVQALYKAIEEKNIPYYWHKNNNLIGSVKATVLKCYADKLKDVLDAIEVDDADRVAVSLLSADELADFKESEFYKRQLSLTIKQNSFPSLSSSPATPTVVIELAKSISVKISGVCEEVVGSVDRVDGAAAPTQLVDLLQAISQKVDLISRKVKAQNEKIEKLEAELNDKNGGSTTTLAMLIDIMKAQDRRLKMLEEKGRENPKRFKTNEINSEIDGLVTDAAALAIVNDFEERIRQMDMARKDQEMLNQMVGDLVSNGSGDAVQPTKNISNF